MSLHSVSLHRRTFRKKERLCSRKTIQALALKGKNIQHYPIRMIWLPATFEKGIMLQAAFTVPKRKFSNAVDRNKIKRRMKEAYRKNKSKVYSLLTDIDRQFALLFVYTGKEIADYSETEKKIITILHQFAEDIKRNTD